MTRISKLKITLLLIILFSSFTSIFSEKIVDNDFKFSLDIPEGFNVTDNTDDGLSYFFEHPDIPVTFVMKITTDNSYQDSKMALEQSFSKLKAQNNIDNFLWNDTECAIGTFSVNLDKNYSGWGVSAPTQIAGSYLVLLCYSPSDKGKSYEHFMMSILNSLCIDEKKYNTPGIIVSYAFPNLSQKEILLNIGGKKIKTSINESDEEASKFVIDIEYSVLTFYANHKLIKDAWIRYYKMIYRDNYGRLQNVNKDIYNTLYKECKNKNHSNPDIEYAQMLLSWVQNFEYRRAESKRESDFTSLPTVLTGTGNDCDSRSMLVCSLLNSIGVETLFLFSPEYSHAMPAAKINAPGQSYITEDGTKYLFGETTAKVTWGMIAKNHADRTKWIPVAFSD